MKYQKSLFIVFYLLIFSFSLNAQSVNDLPTISVTGTAEVFVVPDEAVFTLKVEETKKELSAAKKENDRVVSLVLALTKKFGIAEKDVKTDYISVSEDYETVGRGDARRRVFAGYEVSKTVIVRLRDLTKFESFFSEVLQTGVSEVENVKFATSKNRQYRDEAREKAMIAAKEKATALAKAIGQTIGRAVDIDERATVISIDANISSNDMIVAGDSGNSSATFSAGTISIKARVAVKFLLN